MKKILVVGSLNMDYVVNVNRFPNIGETVTSNKLELIPGGKGANQAYAASILGGSVAMLGAVGEDRDGEILLNNLKSVGVNVSNVKVVPEVNTGTALIPVDSKGNNSIIVVGGANKAVSTEYVQKNMKLIEESDIVILQMEIPLTTVLYVARVAHLLGKYVILDPAPAVSHLPDELYSYIDLIKPNETEISILVGESYQEENLEIYAQWLRSKGVNNVIITLGGAGSFLVNTDGVPYRFYAKTATTVVDTTAAGDSFIASIAVALAKEATLKDAVLFASMVADIVVSRHGAQSSIPSIGEILSKPDYRSKLSLIESLNFEKHIRLEH